MNIYYWKKINIDIPLFWKEIGKMSITPFIFSFIGIFIIKNLYINFINLSITILIFSLLYLTSCWFFDLNHYERNLIKTPLLKFWNNLQ